tara:strand:- start:357 stop:2027 length:1671 start_codon:yes stop_codon:yes gene_type:complete
MFYKKLYIAFFIILLTSCSNNNSHITKDESLDASKINTNPINLQYWESIQKFKVIDGYVEGANVFVDWNYNNLQDDGEISAYWTGITNPYDVCIEWDIDNDTCATTVQLDPPDNYYWWVDESIIPDKDTLDSLEMTKEEWLLYAFPEFDGSPTFVNAGIDNYSWDCFNKTLKLAEVPVGAYDSVRGQVTKPYSLYLSYGYGNQTLKFSNITPFSTILLKGVENADILSDVSKACGTEWWGEVTTHVEKIETLLDWLSTNLEIDRFFFFDDFIVSNDENKILQAERIVDHLSTLFDIIEIIKENNNLETIYERLNNETLASILSDPNFTSIEFDLLAEEPIKDSWRRRVHYNDLNLNAQGQLLLKGMPVDISYENISIASSLHAMQDVYSGSNDLFNFELIDSTSIFYNSTLEREIENKKFIIYLGNHTNQISNGLYNYRETADSLNYIIDVDKKFSNLFPYDIDKIVRNTDLVSVSDIHKILINLPLEWNLVEELKALMAEEDRFTIQKDFDKTTVAYMYSSDQIECIIYETSLDNVIDSRIGEEGFELCNSYFAE